MRGISKFGSSPRLWGTLLCRQREPSQSRFIPTPVGNTTWPRIMERIPTVHPHACGEHFSIVGRKSARFGSSPRLWGTREMYRFRGESYRFIPTPVGNTSATTNKAAITSVHPHACGEHSNIWAVPTIGAGSSPRLWGTRQRSPAAWPSSRFIPTPVGNTCLEAGAGVPGAVHPHACGEHPHVPITHPADTGSSPRLWGTLAAQIPQQLPHRFIPTPVGNTRPAPWARRQRPVHPHACGEHALLAIQHRKGHGSSPRLWGTRCSPFPGRSRYRFIPTPVGNTPHRWARIVELPVHPHACGEHAAVAGAAGELLGSSPRLWGTRRRRGGGRDCYRFIPTPVGNTRRWRFSPSWPPVHPHACGEHDLETGPSRGLHGSSPRLWGTRRQTWDGSVRLRFIPTPVGNTEGLQVIGLGQGGSSPRLWGTLGASVFCFTLLRFIPTPVGNTIAERRYKVNASVHPHACGEHKDFLALYRIWTGSSPRLWGTREKEIAEAQAARFIPTPVGNTAHKPFELRRSSVHPHACGEHTSSNSPGSQHLLDNEIATG